jgi:hypothetical protein
MRYSRVFLAFFLLLSGVTLLNRAVAQQVKAAPTDDYSRAAARLNDPKSTDDAALDALLAIRKMPIQNEAPDLWSKIAADASFSVQRRRYAICQIVDRRLLPGMTIAQIGNLLEAAGWLTRDDVGNYSRGHTGPPTVQFMVSSGDTIGIIPHLGGANASPWNLGFGFDGKPDPGDIYLSLIGKPSSADSVRITQASVINHTSDFTGKMAGFVERSSWPNHWAAGPKQMDAAMATIASAMAGYLNAGSDGNPPIDPDNSNKAQVIHAFNIVIVNVEYELGKGDAQPGIELLANIQKCAELVGEYYRHDLLRPSDSRDAAKTCSDSMTAAVKEILISAGKMTQDKRNEYEMSFDELLIRKAQ